MNRLIAFGFVFCVGCAEPTTQNTCLDFADAVCNTLSRCSYPEYEECMESYENDCSLVTEIKGPIQDCINNIRFGFFTCTEDYPPAICDDVIFVKEE